MIHEEPTAAVADTDITAGQQPLLPPRPRSRHRQRLLATLASRQAMRRAVLVHEILDPPVALRRPRT